MRVLSDENEKSKRNSLQTEGIIGQLKRDNEELQQKVEFSSNYRYRILLFFGLVK
jgi:hypothetical protein